MLKLLLRTFVSKFNFFKKTRPERLHVDISEKKISPINGQMYCTIVGWYHSINKALPRLQIRCGAKFFEITLDVPRPDVQAAFGPTEYHNGFHITFHIPEFCKSLELVNNATGNILNNIPVNKLNVVALSTKENRIAQWIGKIPPDLRDFLWERSKNIGFKTGLADAIRLRNDFLNNLPLPENTEKGYNIIGYISGSFGLAQACRAFVDYKIENGDRLSLVDFIEPSHKNISSEEEQKYLPYYFRPLVYNTNVFYLDTHWIGEYLNSNSTILKNRKNVISFWWEFESGHEERLPILQLFDEVLVFSDFIKNLLLKVPDRKYKVSKIKYPFYKNWEIDIPATEVRRKYNLENKFCFFFNFDFYSGYRRKNPEAILKAFYQAFKYEESTVIVFKTNGAEDYTESAKMFRELIDQFGLNERVVLINDVLSRNEFMSLLNAMDCYVSLHRGEGLGLGILEAFALGNPVIATNYGGNSEYMDRELAYPVNYIMVEADDDLEPYKNVLKWADPDLEHAQMLMRVVYQKYQ